MFVRLIWVLKAHKHTYCLYEVFSLRVSRVSARIFYYQRDYTDYTDFLDIRTEGTEGVYQRDYFVSRKDADLRRGYVC